MTPWVDWAPATAPIVQRRAITDEESIRCGMWQVATDAVSAPTLDASAFLSALLGGLLALAGTWLNARLDRQTKRDEGKTRLQHETLIQLQDDLEIFYRETYAIHLWRETPAVLAKYERELADNLPEELQALRPPVKQSLEERAKEIEQKLNLEERFEDVSHHLVAWTDARFRIEKLVERVDNQALRGEVAQLIAVTKSVLTADVWGEAEMISKRLNSLIGELFRHGVATSHGFIIPRDHSRW